MQTHQVAQVLRYALLAEKKSINILPKFESLTKSGSELTLRLKKYPISLRSLLNNRATLPSKAKKIVRAILRAYQVLDDEELILRNIQPSSIYFTTDLKHVMFGDIRKISFADENDDLSSSLERPYNAFGFQHVSWLKHSDPIRDLFSVFLCILEVYVGTELVLNIASSQELALLLSVAKYYISKETFELLNWGLLHRDKASPASYIKWLDDFDADRVAAELSMLSKAAGDHLQYSQLAEGARRNLVFNRKRYAALFQVELEDAHQNAANDCQVKNEANQEISGRNEQEPESALHGGSSK